MMRLFDGDWKSEVLDASNQLINISTVLSKNTVHPSSFAALQNVVSQTLLPPVMGERAFSIAILQDTSYLLENKQLVLAALSDIHELLLEAKNQTKQRKILKQLDLHAKKVYFFLVYSNEQNQILFEKLGREAQVEWESQRENTFPKQEKQTQEKQQLSPLIEELS